MNAFPQLLTILACVALLQCPARALIQTGKGEPVRDAGWPEGALAVANLKSRVGWWEGPPFGGGEWHFLYRGDQAAFEAALAAFATIRAPVLELVIHDGGGETPFLEGGGACDWGFTVWVPANWHRLYNNPKSFFGSDQPQFRQPVDPPRLDLFVREGGVDFSKVKVPANVRVKDERAAAAGIDPKGGAVIRADFYDMTTEKPVTGAHLIVSRLPEGAQNRGQNYETVVDAVSNADGRALAEKIPAGNVRITVTAEGYAPRLLAYDRFSPTTFRPFVVTLAKAATLRGAVVDSADKPIQGAQVRASSTIALDGRGYPPPDSPNPAPVITDAEGRFALADLPTGFATLHIQADAYYFPGLFTLHDVPAAVELRVRLERACKVRVNVTDKSGAPLAKLDNAPILVEIEPKDGPGVGKWSGSAEVKADGTHEFSGMPAGEYRLKSHPNPSNVGRTYVPEQVVKVEPNAPVIVTFKYP